MFCLFSIEADGSSNGVIRTVSRLDREAPGGGSYLLTIKCFRPYQRQLKSGHKLYDPSELDEIQVRVVVNDIDDNDPKFLAGQGNITLGVRVNAPVYTEVTTLKAVDPDPNSMPVHYKLINVTYHRPIKVRGVIFSWS